MCIHVKCIIGNDSIAFFFKISFVCVYLTVCFNPLCPISAPTVLISTLFSPDNNANPKACLAQCQVICFLILARAVHFFNAFRHPVWLGRSNTNSSLLLGFLG